MRITVSVNGEERSSEVEPRRLLVHHLRDDLGLTGTNVGCDTSSCGACTVLLDGESVKSCTVLAVQADGHEVTTIEGLAATAGAVNGDATLHPMQQAFHTEHGLQCGFCTPGMVMAAVSLLAENAASQRGRRARRPRGQPVPLHRLPQHRAGRAGRRRRRGPGMTATDETAAASGGAFGQRLLRKEDARLLTGEARFVDDLAIPGALWLGMVRSPFAHARIGSIDTSAALEMPGVRQVLTGEDLRDAYLSPMPCAWPVTDDMKAPEHWPLATGKACYVGDIVAVVVADSRYGAADAVDAVVVDYDPLPAVSDLEEAASDSVVIHDALGTNRSYTWTLSPDPAAVEAAFAGAAHTVERDLRPAAADPRGHGAPGRGRGPRRVRRRPHPLLGHPDPAHPQGADRRRVRRARAQGAGGRPVGGRRLRVQAQRLRRGADRGGGGPAAWACRPAGPRAAPRTRWPPSRAGARSSTWSWPPTPTARSRPCGPTSPPTWAPTSSW